MNIKKILLRIWRCLPYWLQELAGLLVRPHYQVGVGAVIFNDQGQVLLCEHTYRRVHPWGLPGGDLQYKEDPLDGVRREVVEETGLQVINPHLLLVENSTLQRHLTLIYTCEGTTGEFKPSDEVSRIQYFDLDNLPDFVPMQKVTLDRALNLIKSSEKGTS